MFTAINLSIFVCICLSFDETKVVQRLLCDRRCPRVEPDDRPLLDDDTLVRLLRLRPCVQVRVLPVVVGEQHLLQRHPRVGEIRLGVKTTTRYADSPHGNGEIKLTDTSTVAVYAKLRTPAQVARANRLNEELYGAMYKVTAVNYPARPYMRPALEAVKPMLPDFWATSVEPAVSAA